MSKRNLVFFAILIFSLLIRLERLDFPLSDIFWWGDGSRDYLVANHILKYQEFPKLGPFNLLYDSGLRNSPLYFYTLALFLIPFNHPVTLTFINICLQITVLILIYLITRKIFDQTVALSAMALYSFSIGVIKQSNYIWQPYLMYPVALLGLYFFIIAYFNKSFKFFLVSLVTASVAVSLHMSAILWLIIFLLSGILLFKFRKVYVLGSFAAVFITLGLLYAPTIPLQDFNKLPSPLAVNGISQYFNNLTANLTEVLSMFNISFPFLLVFMAISFVAFVTGLIRSKWFILTILMFFAPIILASFINKIRPNYLILSLGPFIVWITVLINLTSQKIGKILILSVLFIVFSGNLNFFREELPFENLRYFENISDKILVELNSISDSFRIQSYAFENHFFEYPVLDSMLLVPLEDKLKKKLTKVSDESPYNFIQLNKKDYVFIFCYTFNVTGRQISCIDEFIKKHTDYKFLKTVYLDKNLEIYLFKKS